jgi:hypothetical protein
MSLLAGLVTATVLVWTQADTVPARRPDSTTMAVPVVLQVARPEPRLPEVAPGGPVLTAPVALQAADLTLPQDTVRRRPRAKAVTYSDGYATRLRIHRVLSWAMLPLFAVSYVSGDQIIEHPSDAPEWARSIHPVAATGTAILFGANTITGTWNLWEGRHDPNGRTKRLVHGALFMVASGGFAYTGTKLANDAEQDMSKRRSHRNMALASMGVSTASWLLMLIGD